MTTLHVVPHTHWDREWYRTFQQFRARLVRLIDQLLDLLEADPDYRTFTLDGQTIILDDYLAIRPEREGGIRRLVQGGRLLVGPWYILPDEFLEGPEAMIRNLLLGRQGCRRFTAEPQPMERIGYLPDPFGHVSQLPQIAAGFGMEALCFWRGVGDAPTEFRWAAPDGTERLVLHLRESYSNGAWLADDEPGFIEDLAAEQTALACHAATSHLLIMNGTDHMEARADLPARLRAAEAAFRRAAPYANEPLIHSTLPAYLAAVCSELGPDGLASLPLRRGELRSPQRAHLLPAVLSTRMWIKQRNAQCEALLVRWAEPFSALAGQVAGPIDHRGFLRRAWTWLLQNHPHDSICGCSVDQVHREMEARFAWSEQIAEEVTQESLIAIAQQVGTGLAAAAKDTEGTSRVVVFNPTASLRTDRACVRIRPTPPAPWGLVDAEGRTVPHRVLGSRLREQYHEEMDSEMLRTWVARAEQRKGQIAGHLHIHGVRAEREEDKALVEIVVGSEPVELQPGDLACVETLLADRQIEHFQVRAIEDCGTEIEFLARDVPGVGYASLAVAHTRPSSPPPGIQAALAIENEFFRVAADRSHGTLTVIDKGTGLVLEGANRFVDGGDRGDEYTYCPPEWDRLVDAPAAPPSVRCADDGLGSTLEIAMHYRLPRALADGDRARRSSDEVELPITSRVTLTPGVRRIEFETWLDNRARDHRLRVHFPTPICTDRSWAEGHFDIVERPVARPTDTEGWAEQPVGTHPQLGFVDVNDGQRGLLLANRGLPEYEILPGTGTGGGVTLALTLLRCVGWLSRADLHNREGHAGPPEPVPEAQCLGEHRCHYALIPHAGNYLSAFQEAHAFNAPLRAVHIATQCGPLPSNGRFVEVSPAAVVLTCIKPPVEGKGLVVRIYNSAPVPVRARLKLWRPFHRADLVPLSEEETLQRLAEAADHVSLPLRPKAIATVRFSFDVDLGYA